MGNEQQKEQSFDPKIMEEHRRKMGQLQGQYSAYNVQAPGAYSAHRVENK